MESKKIFDTEIMRVASDFRFMPSGGYMTLGVTEHLIAETFSDWLEKVIDDIIARRESE